MTMTEGMQGHEVAHATRLYRKLLTAYPRSFREQYGDQMVQVFEELAVSTHRADGGPLGGLWARVLKDLVPSASRERGAVLLGPGGRGPLAFVVLAVVVALLVVGTGQRLFILMPLLILIALPTLGVVLLRRAWLVRRTTGAAAGPRAIAGGAALLVPAAVFLAAVGPDRGWYIVMTIILALICGCMVTAVWAVSTLVAGRAGTDESQPNRRRRAVLVLVAGVLIVGGMAAAGYNSYRKSQPPPGDHSVANASPDSRALWEAAWAGDVAGTDRLVAACADPFVQFSGHGQIDLRARSVADWQAGGWGNTDPVPEAERPRFRRVVALLQDAEDTWSTRCGSS